MENQVRCSGEEEGARGGELMRAGDMNGLPTGYSSSHLSAPFREPRQLCGCHLPAQNSWKCALKRRLATHFTKVVITQSWKGLLKLKESCVPSQASGTVESAHGCKHDWQPTLRVTFISRFDKDMGALIDGTFQRKNNTSEALEIYYWIKEGGRQQSNRHRSVAQLCILEGCKSPFFHEEGAP